MKKKFKALLRKKYHPVKEDYKMWKGILITIGVIIILIIIIKLSTRNRDYRGSSLDGRLSSIRRSWSDVCKKILNRSEC